MILHVKINLYRNKREVYKSINSILHEEIELFFSKFYFWTFNLIFNPRPQDVLISNTF